jgi:hypothetical protein
MTIKHIFIGGGNIYGFSFFGLLKQTHLNNIWSHENIKSIYGISSGAIVGTVISLNLEWEILEDYFINRPWDKVFNLNMYSILNSIQNRGIFSQTEFYEIFKPLFLAKELSCEITMLEFYNYTGIEHYFIVTKINLNKNKLEYLTISYKTHPDWKLLDVVYMSSCLPIFFSPIFIDNDIYFDGIFGFKNNIIQEIYRNNNNIKIDINEILFVSLDNQKLKPLTLSSSLFDFLIFFLLFLIKMNKKEINIKHINNFKIKREPFNFDNFYLVICNKEERIKLINLGINTFNNSQKDISLPSLSYNRQIKNPTHTPPCCDYA